MNIIYQHNYLVTDEIFQTQIKSITKNFYEFHNKIYFYTDATITVKQGVVTMSISVKRLRFQDQKVKQHCPITIRQQLFNITRCANCK